MSFIETKDLSYAYTVFERKAGFINGLKDFLARKKSYVQALEHIDISIQAGESIGVLGENGAGKTTLMKLLSGIITPKSGELLVMGHQPHKREKAFLTDIGVMFGQKSQLIWDLPPADCFDALCAVYKQEPKAWKKELLSYCKELGVEEKLYVPTRKLSLGQRAIFNVIAAVMHHPRLLLLDEPTLGIDVLSQSKIYSFLGRMRDEWGTTILLTSHNTKDIYALARRVIFLKNGKLLFDGPIGDFGSKDGDSHSYLIRTVKDELPRGFDQATMHSEREDYAYFRIDVRDPNELKKFDMRDITQIQETSSDLDEVLKSFYGDNYKPEVSVTTDATGTGDTTQASEA